MNHKASLAIAAIVAAVAITAVAFAVPQQALAHYAHHSNSIKVDQQIKQLNACTNSSSCQNDASNDADIYR